MQLGPDGPVGIPVALAGALGGVLGDVAGQRRVGDLPGLVLDPAGASRGDGAEVDLGAPAEYQGCAARAGHLEADRAGGVVDGVAQRVEGEAGRGRVVRAVGAVEPDRGVEVHQPAALVFGDLGVGQPRHLSERAGRDAEPDGEVAAQGDGEAVPELPGVGLPEHRARYRCSTTDNSRRRLFGAARGLCRWQPQALGRRAPADPDRASPGRAPTKRRTRRPRRGAGLRDGPGGARRAGQ